MHSNRNWRSGRGSLSGGRWKGIERTNLAKQKPLTLARWIEKAEGKRENISIFVKGLKATLDLLSINHREKIVYAAEKVPVVKKSFQFSRSSPTPNELFMGLPRMITNVRLCQGGLGDYNVEVYACLVCFFADKFKFFPSTTLNTHFTSSLAQNSPLTLSFAQNSPQSTLNSPKTHLSPFHLLKTHLKALKIPHLDSLNLNRLSAKQN